MKSLLYKSLWGLAIMSLLASCEGHLDLFEDYDEVAPEITISSIAMIDELNAEVSLRITEDGGQAIVYAGMQHSLNPNMLQTENHTLITPDRYAFSLEARDLIPDSTYYFRPIVVNEFTYYYGEITSLTVPKIPAPTVPCEVPPFTIQDNGNEKSAFVSDHGADPSVIFGKYEIEVHCSSCGFNMWIYFNNTELKNGIYTTVSYQDIDNFEQYVLVELRFDGGFITEIAKPGDQVYIVENEEEGTIDIEFCDLTYELFDTTIPLAGHIVVQ